MGLPIHVDAYAGYRADERPRRFALDGVEYRIYAWEQEWRTPDLRCFLVRAGGSRYVLAHDEHRDEWRLEPDHDGAALFARPHLEIRTVDDSVIRKVQRQILGCEHCHPDEAFFPFEHILATVVQAPPHVQFLLSAIARCRQCGAEITEATLVDADT